MVLCLKYLAGIAAKYKQKKSMKEHFTKHIFALDSKVNVIKSFENESFENAINCKALKKCSDYFGIYRSHAVAALCEVYALHAFKNYEYDFYIAFDLDIFKHLHKIRMQESELCQRLLMCNDSKFNADYLHKKKRQMSSVIKNLAPNSYFDLQGCVIKSNHDVNVGIIMINDIFTTTPTEVYYPIKYNKHLKKGDFVSFDLVAQKNGLLATQINKI